MTITIKIMDLDWCIVCDKHTSGGIYCSQVCRNKDTPNELKGKPPVVPGPLDKKRLVMPMTNYSSNKSSLFEYHVDDEEEEDTHISRVYRVDLGNGQRPPTDLYVSYGALTNHSALDVPNINNPNKKKFLPRQQHLYHPTTRQETRVF